MKLATIKKRFSAVSVGVLPQAPDCMIALTRFRILHETQQLDSSSRITTERLC